jgi:hypothetical protein
MAVHVPYLWRKPSLRDDVAVPWHYTTLVDFIDHWQTLIAGLIALIAAVITVFVTLKVERRKVDRELDALRKSLAIELRQLIPRALGVHASLAKLGGKTDGPITARMVESLSRMPVPIVYPANAHKIGLLEEDAMDVVVVYPCRDLAVEDAGTAGSRDHHAAASAERATPARSFEA